MSLLRTLPALLLVTVLLGSGCVHARYSVPPTPDFYTFGPAVQVEWSYGCALPACGYPSRWVGNRWVYWTGTYWAYDEGGAVYAYTHVRSRPTGVRYARPRNVVVVPPGGTYPPYPPPVQRPVPYAPGGYGPVPTPYAPGTPPPRRRNPDDRSAPPPSGPTSYAPAPSGPGPHPR